MSKVQVGVPANLKICVPGLEEAHVVRREGSDVLVAICPRGDEVMYFGSSLEYVCTYSTQQWYLENHTLLRIIPARKLVITEETEA